MMITLGAGVTKLFLIQHIFLIQHFWAHSLVDKDFFGQRKCLTKLFFRKIITTTATTTITKTTLMDFDTMEINLIEKLILAKKIQRGLETIACIYQV